ncbi:hypothetical protein FN846DRAFT_166866 [Sphaerosporella brunnea]|uniref:Uncharacterized protein n=1 Tax=Sphaerosporella brunnea TaxID=1250544 RepID=A0A5J5EQU9_9PEZI|nr:hypothetical protein FN846DRAFT_166866 [Sphaerosporella brunnea]
MERFRGFVQKLAIVGGGSGGGNDPSRPGTPASTTETLAAHLPLTKTYISQTFPRQAIVKAAEENDRKAEDAARLVKRVDRLICAHEEAARDLKGYVKQLAGIQKEVDDAARTAKSIQQQLLSLEELIAAAGRDELADLEKAEEARFEAYAREQRQKVEQLRRSYDQQLAEFQKERTRVLSDDGGGGGAKRKVEVRKNGLEQVRLEEEGGLEDFLGDEEIREIEDSAKMGKGKAKEEAPARKGKAKTKGKEKPPPSPLPPPPQQRKGNHAILADEDIEDEEEMLGFYR